jgi:hypothetical protein
LDEAIYGCFPLISLEALLKPILAVAAPDRRTGDTAANARGEF